jgi:hypothetical protein
VEVYNQIVEHLDECLSRDRFGSLVAALCIDRVPLGNALYVARATGFDGVANEGTPQASQKKGKLAGMILGTRRPARADSRRLSNVRFGEVAVVTWINHMRTVAQSEAFARSIGVPVSMLKEIVAEITGAAQRKKLAEAIADRLDRVLHIENPDSTVHKATVVASAIINNFATTLGYAQLPVDKRPLVQAGESDERPIFQAVPVVHDATGIGEQRSGFADKYAFDWCEALRATVTDNASSEDGLSTDPRQNQRLGEILDQLRV